MPITGLNASQLASYRTEAQRLIAKYDRNGDGKLDRTEAARPVSMGSDSYNFTNRISHDYVEVTTVYQDNYSKLDMGNAMMADKNGDGAVDADELVDSYLEQKDSNHNGSLSFWEKMGMGTGNFRGRLESSSSVETDRRTRTEYDPEIDVVYVPSTPIPPAPDYRPTPPPVVVNPYSPGPTPPAPNYRPAPPSPSTRPTPPSIGGSTRPTPPSPGSSSRPTPPRI